MAIAGSCWGGIPTAVLPLCIFIYMLGGEGDDRGWDGWIASPTPWTQVWASSGSWWWIGNPGVLQSMELQSRTRLSDWTELNAYKMFKIHGVCCYSLPWIRNLVHGCKHHNNIMWTNSLSFYWHLLLQVTIISKQDHYNSLPHLLCLYNPFLVQSDFLNTPITYNLPV